MAAFLIYVKRCLRLKMFLSVLIFMPVIAVIFTVFGKNVIGEVKFGIYAEGNFGKYISDELEKEVSFKFIKYDSIEKMYQDIVISEIDSGYVFDKDFENAVRNFYFDKSIKILRSDSSGGYKFANEIVFSKVFNIAAPMVSNAFLNDIGINETVDKYYNDILERLNVFSFNFIEVGDSKNVEGNFRFENIFACFVFIGSVFGSAVCIGDKKRNIRKGSFLNIMAFSALLAFSAFISTAICGEADLFVLLKFIVFIFSSAAFAYLFTFIKNVFLLYGIMPVLIIFSFLISVSDLWIGTAGIFYDFFKWIFPVGLYCEGNIIGMLCYFCVIMILRRFCNE